MAVNFFEREVKKVRQRFNQTFGRQIVCNLNARYSAILSICWLGILANRINEAEHKEKAKESIHEFTRIRDVLNNFFNLMEKQEKERRSYANRKKNSNGKNDRRRRSGSLPELRQYLQDSMA